jgi:hypothetical protein
MFHLNFVKDIHEADGGKIGFFLDAYDEFGGKINRLTNVPDIRITETYFQGRTIWPRHA